MSASPKGVTLIGGGAVTAEDLSLALSLAPVLVAADGGADAAIALGHLPDRSIGDFDSLDAAARDAIPAERLHRIAEQESTDFEKCLERIEAPLVIGVGYAQQRIPTIHPQDFDIPMQRVALADL